MSMRWLKIGHQTYQSGDHVIRATSNPTALRPWHVDGPLAGKAYMGFFRLRDAKKFVAQHSTEAPLTLAEIEAWCEAHDSDPTEWWLARVLNAEVSVEEMRSAIREDRAPVSGK